MPCDDLTVIHVQRDGQAWLLEIDRPERRNALDIEHCYRLADAVDHCIGQGARALMVTGAGSSFCAGADFAEVTRPEFRGALRRAVDALTGAAPPVVAAVNGPAIGAGLQLAVACDLRITAEAGRFALPTAQLGLAVDAWTVRRLALLIGAGTAAGLLLAGDELDAPASVAVGLSNRMGGRDEAWALTTRVAGLAPLTLSFYKQVLGTLAGTPVPEADLDAALERCWASADLVEGQRARDERRAPRFEGR